MSVERIEAHLRYIGISDGDVLALQGVRPLIEEHADAFVDHFYAHLKAFEETRTFLTDEMTVQRLLQAQRAYLLSIFDAKFDASYFAHRCKVGQTHFRIGLSFRWYIGAYELYLKFFMPLLQQHLAGDTLKLSQVESALRKAILLDMSIVLEAYHEGDKMALQLSQAQVLHQEKLASVGLLASGFAHEIGNPLASISVICDNLLRKELDPKIADKFQRIREQSSRITNIVQQLVYYARPGSQLWQKVDVNASIEAALLIARLSRNAKTISVRMELDENVLSTVGISDQLSQVFLNLFLNAIDSMNEQGGELQIQSYLSDQNIIGVRVTDNGCGIPSELLTKIFAPFFTTKEVGKGTGLGLYVSNGIVKKHGGEIRVESTAGRGSTFTVILPIRNKAIPEVSD